MPMFSQADVLRTQYGRRGIVRILGQQLRSARRLYPRRDEAGSWVYPESEEESEEGGAPRPVAYYLNLPPRVEEKPVVGEDGKPTGEVSIEFVERHPGVGEHVQLEWPDYYEPTAADRKAETDELQAAAGAKPVMSQRTAVELVARARGRDPGDEQRRLDEEREQDARDRLGMFDGGAGGRVGGTGELPEGAEPLGGGKAAELPAQTLELIYTVNQLLAMRGDGPLAKADGSPDPDGNLSATLYRAKVTAAGSEAGKLVGQAEGEAESAAIAEREGVPAPTPGGSAEGEPPAF
jgi:hypothetical protein